MEYRTVNTIDYLSEAVRDLRARVERLERAQQYSVTKVNSGCAVCGIGANGEFMGYVCHRDDCPTRVTYRG